MDAIDKVLSQALDTAMTRQSTLAANIANADTHGYVRQDVDFEAEMQKVIEAGADQEHTTQVQSQPGQPVKLENEMVEISKNTTLYSSVAKITALRMRILEASIGGGN